MAKTFERKDSKGFGQAITPKNLSREIGWLLEHEGIESPRREGLSTQIAARVDAGAVMTVCGFTFSRVD